jgi:hypothetical protein
MSRDARWLLSPAPTSKQASPMSTRTAALQRRGWASGGYVLAQERAAIPPEATSSMDAVTTAPDDSLQLLVVLTEAYNQPLASGAREAILHVTLMGGDALQHHALPGDLPPHDRATFDELRSRGLISFDHQGRGSMMISPTQRGQKLVAALKRTDAAQPVADLDPLMAALESQAKSGNALAWPVVRPVLVALRDYWAAGGFSPDGIATRPLIEACADEYRALFAATIRTLVDAGYLANPSGLTVGGIAAELELTPAARSILDGWPGADPSELVQSLVAVLTERAASEQDPLQKKRWQSLLDTLKELGVGVTSEVLAKVLTGGH